jgi:hypothetical protein
MGRIIKAGSTDQSIEIYIIDSSDGTPETGVVFDTAGIDLKYRREGATVVSITEADLVTPALDDAHADGGFLAIGNGSYRLDLPDAAVAAGADSVVVFGTVTGMIVLPVTIQLVDVDLQDTIRAGLTALPAAAADAAGGLPISDAGGLDIDAKLAATNEVTAARMGALTDWIDGGRLDLLLDAILLDTGTTIDDLVDDLESRLGTPSDLGSGASIAANLADIEAQTDDIGVAGAGLTDLGGMSTTMKGQVNTEVDGAFTTQMADSTVADGTIPTREQAILAIIRFLMERSISSTTMTVYKEDGTTAVMVFTLDDAADPTSITRAT